MNLENYCCSSKLQHLVVLHCKLFRFSKSAAGNTDQGKKQIQHLKLPWTCRICLFAICLLICEYYTLFLRFLLHKLLFSNALWNMPSSQENLKTIVYVKVKGAESIMGDLRIENWLFATCTSLIMHLICSPKFCVSIVFNFSWEAVIPRRTQEKVVQILRDNIGGQISCIVGDVQVANYETARETGSKFFFKTFPWCSSARHWNPVFCENSKRPFTLTRNSD